MTGTIVSLAQCGVGSIQLTSGRTLWFCASLVAKDSWRPFRHLQIGDIVAVERIDFSDPRGPVALNVRWLSDAPETKAS